MNALNIGNDPAWHGGENTSHEVLRNFVSHLMAAREEERKHLANEIHDKLGQNLLALRIDVSRLHARTLESHPRINGKASTLLGDLDIAIQNIRDIINHLRPPVLDLGLIASVEWKVREFEKYSKIPCSLIIQGEDQEYTEFDGHAPSVSRILHEALTNVARHANATSAEVALSSLQKMLTIAICDDGTGILPGDLNKPKVYGLMGVKEYARMLNGTVSIEGKNLSRGTSLSVVIPAIN